MAPLRPIGATAVLSLVSLLGACAPQGTSPEARAEAACQQRVPPRAGPPPAARVSADPAAPSPAWAQVPLSAEELALQRFLSHITHETRGAADPWAEWYVNPSQTGLDAVRYPLAFGAYASFLLGARTPAYPDRAARQMRDAIERMLDPMVWDYIEVYWADEPTFPDPVWVENVMYSGHLLQMMAQYELLTGDRRYSEEGFDFVWHDGTVIHYDLHRLARRIYDMMGEHVGGGLPCEPDLVFVYCNNHSALGLMIYDRLYPSGYGAAVERWRTHVQRAAPFRVQRAPSFFRIVYLDAEGVWVPYGEAGGDAWGLGWMAPWNHDRAFLAEGWEDLLDNGRFIEEPSGAIHLDASLIMESMVVSDATATSFLPLLARQMEGATSEVAAGVFQWYEGLADWSDGDGDGYAELLSYHSDDIDRNVVSANVAAGMATLGPDMMADTLAVPSAVFGRPWRVSGVDEQDVDVPLAHHLDGGGVRVRVAPARPGAAATTGFEVLGPTGPVEVLRDGVDWTGWSATEGGIHITTDLSAPHTFDVRPRP